MYNVMIGRGIWQGYKAEILNRKSDGYYSIRLETGAVLSYLRSEFFYIPLKTS